MGSSCAIEQIARRRVAKGGCQNGGSDRKTGGGTALRRIGRRAVADNGLRRDLRRRDRLSYVKCEDSQQHGEWEGWGWAPRRFPWPLLHPQGCRKIRHPDIPPNLS